MTPYQSRKKFKNKDTFERMIAKRLSARHSRKSRYPVSENCAPSLDIDP